MKKIEIKTKVKGDPKSIIEKFDVKLFNRLCPPITNVEINRFDGVKIDNETHLVCSMLGNYQFWLKRVTDYQLREDEAYYTEKAIELPSPFTYWKHVHKIQKINDEYCYIIDNLTYSTNKKLLDLILYPFIYMLIYYRRPIYMDYFSDKN